MLIPEEQSIDITVVKKFLATGNNGSKVFLMDRLVALYVEEPVAAAGRFGNIGLMRIFRTVGVFAQIPGRLYEPDLVRANAFDLLPGAIIRITVSDRNNKLVNYGKYGFNRRLCRIVELGGISNKCKST
jgi:hypothetical protein